MSKIPYDPARHSIRDGIPCRTLLQMMADANDGVVPRLPADIIPYPATFPHLDKLTNDSKRREPATDELAEIRRRAPPRMTAGASNTAHPTSHGATKRQRLSENIGDQPVAKRTRSSQNEASLHHEITTPTSNETHPSASQAQATTRREPTIVNNLPGSSRNASRPLAYSAPLHHSTKDEIDGAVLSRPSPMLSTVTKMPSIRSSEDANAGFPASAADKTPAATSVGAIALPASISTTLPPSVSSAVAPPAAPQIAPFPENANEVRNANGRWPCRFHNCPKAYVQKKDRKRHERDNH